MNYLTCVLNGLRRWAEFWTSPALWAAVITIVFVVMAIAAATATTGVGEAVLGAGAAALVVLLLVAGATFVVELFGALVACLSETLPPGTAGAATSLGQLAASGQITTCAQAQDLLAQAQQALAAVQAAYNAARAAFDEANRRLRNARTAFIAALGVLAAAIWNPLLLPAVIAATVAAGTLLARRIQQAAQAGAGLAAAAADLARALVDIAAAEALVALLCAASGAPGGGQPGGGVLTGALPMLGATTGTVVTVGT